STLKETPAATGTVEKAGIADKAMSRRRTSNFSRKSRIKLPAKRWRPSLDLNQDTRRFPAPASPFRHRAVVVATTDIAFRQVQHRQVVIGLRKRRPVFLPPAASLPQ